MNTLLEQSKRFVFAGLLALALAAAGRAEEPAATTSATDKPAAAEPDTPLFPLMTDRMREKIGERARQLPPPYGVMALGNWLESDWNFISASISLGDSPYIDIPAGKTATMNLHSATQGAKADLWVLPFLDLMVGGGRLDVDANLNLYDIPLAWDPGQGVTRGDKVVPMKFNGDYYSFGFVIAGAYKRFYGAIDASWVKTKLGGSASLSEDGFWTLTVSPKVGYNMGMTQFYVGARYLSKNEHYVGTVPLPSGHDLGFDVQIETAAWAPIFGIRAVIKHHWELLGEFAFGPRSQITTGVGYRW